MPAGASIHTASSCGVFEGSCSDHHHDLAPGRATFGLIGNDQLDLATAELRPRLGGFRSEHVDPDDLPAVRVSSRSR